MYMPKNKPTKKIIDGYENKGYFFRFQDPTLELSYDSKSWGMIYATEQDAIEDGCEILKGKSCVREAKKLINWVDYFNKYYVVLVFEGKDTYQSGHDGEDVARFEKEIDVFSYEDFKNWLIEQQ